MSIQIDNLSYIYSKGSPFEFTALKNINITIKTGEFVGIIGHTGSGKSTLIQHLNGILKPTEGKVIINGLDVTGKNIKELRKKVGIVFQYPEHQLFEETVSKDIAFGPLKMGLTEKEINERILYALNAVGLKEEVLEKSPFELSGGQKRRVAIAGVLAMKPEILVLDEPTAGLDPKGRDELFGLISALHKDTGVTVILVSHNMEDVARLTGRIIVMNKGSIAMDGSPREIFVEDKRLLEMGLSTPQITILMKRLKTIIPGIDDRIYTIEQAKQELLKYLKNAKL